MCCSTLILDIPAITFIIRDFKPFLVWKLFKIPLVCCRVMCSYVSKWSYFLTSNLLRKVRCLHVTCDLNRLVWLSFISWVLGHWTVLVSYSIKMIRPTFWYSICEVLIFCEKRLMRELVKSIFHRSAKMTEQLGKNVIIPSGGKSLITSRKIFQLGTYKSFLKSWEQKFKFFAKFLCFLLHYSMYFPN